MQSTEAVGAILQRLQHRGTDAVEAELGEALAGQQLSQHASRVDGGKADRTVAHAKAGQLRQCADEVAPRVMESSSAAAAYAAAAP